MIFTELSIPGVWRIDAEPSSDSRGEFARTFCADAFKERGLASQMVQTSTSLNHKRGTLRGMHYRDAADGEAKLIRCTHGKAFDVAVDLRPDSPTYLRWTGLELSAAARNSVYLPPGCAHGFISLTDDTEIFYMMSAPFKPGTEKGVRWNDPALGITWPIEPTVISDRDKSFPNIVVDPLQGR
jgi:dTDP-4-dehydrorhamnose 3,5-epimerase